MCVRGVRSYIPEFHPPTAGSAIFGGARARTPPPPPAKAIFRGIRVKSAEIAIFRGIRAKSPKITKNAKIVKIAKLTPN